MILFIRRSLSRKSRAVAGLVLLLLTGFAVAASAVNVPDRLKAAYLFNFAKLTYWTAPSPEAAARPPGQLVICTLASDELTQALEDASEKPVAGRVVQVVSLGLKSRADFCHMVFVDEAHTAAWFNTLNKDLQGVLLVGESPDFIARGGVISFFLEGDKLRFEISLRNARERQIQLSSRLLKLARVTEGQS